MPPERWDRIKQMAADALELDPAGEPINYKCTGEGTSTEKVQQLCGSSGADHAPRPQWATRAVQWH